jgi:predicted ATP-grasp superfamily ATP-dependent carboligase
MSGARPSAEPGEPSRTVVVSDHINGNSRSAVAAVRALHQDGYRPVVTVSGRGSAAAASRGCAEVLAVPLGGAVALREAVKAYLAARPGARVMPASDAVLIALDLPGRTLVDKSALPERAAAAGLQVPTTREVADGAELLDLADTFDYPVVVKAAVKTASGENTRRVDSPEELRAIFRGHASPVVVQPMALGTMRAVCGVIHDGQLLSVVHQTYLRIWPPDCGTASAAITTHPDLDLEARLPALLAGHCGVFQVQLIGDQVIDVNPRVYGSLPLAVASGANLPAIACRAADGRPPADLVRGRPGVRYRWLEGDVRRLVDDVRTGRLTLRAAGRELLPRRGTAHSVESLRDPAPGLLRLADVARVRRS